MAKYFLDNMPLWLNKGPTVVGNSHCWHDVDINWHAISDKIIEIDDIRYKLTFE